MTVPIQLIMPTCPNCTNEGLEVEKITVIIHAKETTWPLGEERFYICENPECDVVYFNQSSSKVLRKADVKTRVTFKEKDSPRPLCYCKQVTEEEVLKAIANGARNFEEVKKITGIGGGGFCKFTNPAGRCCSRNYKPFIEKELAKLKKEA
ncbi:MAG: (2Fe-2S)-binding protein [Methanomassiliicoccales archaeon]|nr:(2Fe-2S)-binding protein [Methanomassiliicoccales archaeon]